MGLFIMVAGATSCRSRDRKTSLADGVPHRCVEKAFDGVGRGIVSSRAKVDRAINDPITAITQDAYEFEGTICR